MTAGKARAGAVPRVLRRWRWPLFAVLLAAMALPGRGAAANEEQMIVLGTAPVSGVYFPAGGALCRMINAERAAQGLRCVLESTDGSAENLRRLEAGDLDFALVQSDWQFHAYQGSGGPGTERPFVELRAVFSLQAQPLTVVASRESGIAGLADLRGKRVNLGPRGSAVRAAAEVLVQTLGWNDNAFAELTDYGAEDQVKALCAGKIDAFVLPTSHPNGIVAAATEGCLAKVVPIEGPEVEAALAEWPYYTPAIIPGGLYRGNPEAARSFGVRATLVTRAALSPEVVYRVAKSVFDRLDELRRQHPALSDLTASQMIEWGNTAPLHDGAEIFFRERQLN